MAFKVLLDANVILDLFLKREAYASAKKIIAHAVNGTCQAYTTPAVIHIVNHYLAKEFGQEKTNYLIQNLLADVQVLEINHEVTLQALHSKIEDAEDALQYYTGLHHKLDCFISRDKQLRKTAIASLPVLEPEEFLNTNFHE